MSVRLYKAFSPLRAEWRLADAGETAEFFAPAAMVDGIAIAGIEPEHVERIEMLVNGRPVLDIGPGVDADYNPITGGQVAVLLWGLQAAPMVGARFGVFLGLDLTRAHFAKLRIKTTLDLSRRAEVIRVDFMVPMVL